MEDEVTVPRLDYVCPEEYLATSIPGSFEFSTGLPGIYDGLKFEL